MLVQAMVGAISANVRMIGLRFTKECWVIEVTLGEENQADVEEMYDVADEMSIYIEDIKDEVSNDVYKRIECKITISTEQIMVRNADCYQVVFKRRE